MKVIVKKEFYDIQHNKVLRKIGDSFEADQARAEELSGYGVVEIIEEKPAEKPKAKRAKK